MIYCGKINKQSHKNIYHSKTSSSNEQVSNLLFLGSSYRVAVQSSLRNVLIYYLLISFPQIFQCQSDYLATHHLFSEGKASEVVLN